MSKIHFCRLLVLLPIFIFLPVNTYGVGPYNINAGGSTVIDNGTWLEWQREDSNYSMTWTEALLFCEDLYLNGYDDWRLPNIRELSSIVDLSRNNPSIDPAFLGRSVEYWTSTTSLRETDHAWAVHFFSGSNSIFPKSSSIGMYVAYARCVREGYSDPGPFEFNLIFSGNGSGKVYFGDPDAGVDPEIITRDYHRVLDKYYNIDLYAFALPGSTFKGFNGEECTSSYSCHFRLTKDAAISVIFNDPNKKIHVPLFLLLH